MQEARLVYWQLKMLMIMHLFIIIRYMSLLTVLLQSSTPPSVLIQSQVKCRSPQNISGASQ